MAMMEHFKKSVKSYYDQIISVQDTPHNIAFGFGVGVFLGILPFAGVLAAIAVAVFFRLNKAGAILGCALTNTWLGFIILAGSVKTSSWILGDSSQDIDLKLQQLFKSFSWEKLVHPSILEILWAVSLGFLILSFILSLLAYLACLVFIYLKKARG